MGRKRVSAKFFQVFAEAAGNDDALYRLDSIDVVKFWLLLTGPHINFRRID